MARLGYCSACDRNVPVVLRRTVEFGRKPSPRDAEALVCLDYGVRCTGSMCPLFSVEPRPLRSDDPAPGSSRSAPPPSART
jgi:hypothetical protein